MSLKVEKTRLVCGPLFDGLKCRRARTFCVSAIANVRRMKRTTIKFEGRLIIYYLSKLCALNLSCEQASHVDFVIFYLNPFLLFVKWQAFKVYLHEVYFGKTRPHQTRMELATHKSLACCGCFKFCVIYWGEWLAVMIITTRRGNTSQNIGFSTTLKWNYFQKIQDLSNHL